MSNVVNEFVKLLSDEPILVSVAATAAFKAALESYGDEGYKGLPDDVRAFMDRVAEQLDLLDPFLDKLEA